MSIEETTVAQPATPELPITIARSASRIARELASRICGAHDRGEFRLLEKRVLDEAYQVFFTEFEALFKERKTTAEHLETFKQGLHQAKFEYQCLRADLNAEQIKSDQRLTALNEIMVKSHLCVFGPECTELFQQENERLVGEINALACSFFGPSISSNSVPSVSLPPPL